jgi:signal transduction histidine kinase
VKDEAAFYSDRARVLVIFNNLVSNSIRYSDPKKDERFVQCRIHTHSEGASIEFTDNGVGISAEHLDKIFDMFYRANYDSKGSGLGLFIFREAITKLGGFVTVESEPGVGTKFFIRLPNLSKQVTLPWADRQQYESAAPVAAS